MPYSLCNGFDRQAVLKFFTQAKDPEIREFLLSHPYQLNISETLKIAEHKDNPLSIFQYIPRSEPHYKYNTGFLELHLAQIYNNKMDKPASETPSLETKRILIEDIKTSAYIPGLIVHISNLQPEILALPEVVNAFCSNRALSEPTNAARLRDYLECTLFLEKNRSSINFSRALSVADTIQDWLKTNQKYFCENGKLNATKVNQDMERIASLYANHQLEAYILSKGYSSLPSRISTIPQKDLLTYFMCSLLSDEQLIPFLQKIATF
ncbi:MAG: hypothetical protein ACOYK9_00140 [Chlamydiia bacterium]